MVGTLALEHELTLDLAEEFFSATEKFLPWTKVPGAGGAPPTTATIQQHRLFVFVARCSFGNDPATLLALSGQSLFTIAFSQAAWNRILKELIDSGLLQSTAP